MKFFAASGSLSAGYPLFFRGVCCILITQVNLVNRFPLTGLLFAHLLLHLPVQKETNYLQ